MGGQVCEDSNVRIGMDAELSQPLTKLLGHVDQ